MIIFYVQKRRLIPYSEDIFELRLSSNCLASRALGAPDTLLLTGGTSTLIEIVTIKVSLIVIKF